MPLRASSPADSPPRRPGYSLIELTLVLAIVAIIAAIALPRMAASNASSRVEGAAASAASLLRTARESALSTSTTVHVTLHGNSVQIAVVNPATNQSTDVSDLIDSPPRADEITSIGTGSISASAPERERERRRAQRAALLALQERADALGVQERAATASRSELPWNGQVDSADFGGDSVVIFNGHGIPDSGGVAVIRVGSQQRRVVVQAQTGEVSVTR